MDFKIHHYQISILKELLFKPQAKFSELKKIDITNDHFTFHLNQLLREGLVIKENGKYSLSNKGKEFANHMDTETLELEKQAKLSIAIHAVRINKGVIEYLVHRRLKEPFYGWYGSHSGKIKWGETPLKCAQREFLEETGLIGEFSLKGIIHYHHIHQDGTLLEDKYFWVFRVDNPIGNLKERVPEGENIWMTEEEYRKLENVFATFDEMNEVINNQDIVYVDREKIVDSY